MENLKQLGDEAHMFCCGMNQSHKSWSSFGSFRITVFPRVTHKAWLAVLDLLSFDQASKQLKEMSDQAKAVKQESTQDAPLLSPRQRHRCSQPCAAQDEKDEKPNETPSVKRGQRDFGCQTVFRLGGMEMGSDFDLVALCLRCLSNMLSY